MYKLPKGLNGHGRHDNGSHLLFRRHSTQEVNKLSFRAA
jgi:hypothetical protein